MIATSSSDEKLGVAKKLGATHLINYSKYPEWAGEVLKATNNEGVDIVVEVVGAESIAQSVRATRHGGLISLVGMLSKDPYEAVNIMHPLLFKAQTSMSPHYHCQWPLADSLAVQAFLGAGSKQMSDELSAFVDEYKIYPPIARLYEFEEADKALRAAAELTVPGKIVVRL